MNYAKLVEVFSSTDDLLEELACLSLFQLLLFDDVVEKFTATDEFHDQKELLGCLYDLKQLDDVWVPD